MVRWCRVHGGEVCGVSHRNYRFVTFDDDECGGYAGSGWVEQQPPSPFRENPNAPTYSNENGARQSILRFKYSLFPWDALAIINPILVAGAEKYGIDNWRGISWDDHWEHAMHHMVSAKMHPEQRMLHLQHAACRVLFAIACIGSVDKSDDIGRNDNATE